jgi:hypothetical protein
MSKDDSDDGADAFEEEDNGPDAGLSYLDIVTAAFGSAVFLLFIFASLPLDRAGGGGASCYVDLQLEYQRTTAEVEILLVHAARGGDGEGVQVLRTSDRRLAHDVVTGRTDTAGRAHQILLTNYSHAFDEPTPRQGLRILEPEDGVWSVYLNAVTERGGFDQAGSSETTIDGNSRFSPASSDCVTVNNSFEIDTPIQLKPDGQKTHLVTFEVAR